MTEHPARTTAIRHEIARNRPFPELSCAGSGRHFHARHFARGVLWFPRMALDMEFLDQVDSPSFCEKLFGVLPDVLFCIKDTERRYRGANQAFLQRIGLRGTSQLLGRRAEDFFPPDLAAVYREQDEKVLRDHRSLSNELELITHRDGSNGWFLATKVPLHAAGRRLIGLASISRDLRSPEDDEIEIAGIARVTRHILGHPDEDLRNERLAAIAGLSPGQLDRRMKRVFHLTTAQYVRKARIEHAAELLARTESPIADIALECGYSDQTALSRQFRATVGMPPAAFRESRRARS